MKRVVNTAFTLAVSSAFEVNVESLMELNKDIVVGSQTTVQRIEVKPTHHLMTDPAIMRMSKEDYEKEYGLLNEEDKTGIEWFDSIIDHKFIPIDKGHVD